MNNETLSMRASLLAKPHLFSFKDAVTRLNIDFGDEMMEAVLNRLDFDWLVFFENINTSILEATLSWHDEMISSYLSKVDIITLLKATEYKNIDQLWKIIVRRKSEIPYKKSHLFATGLFTSSLSVSNRAVHNPVDIIRDYYSGLRDVKTVLKLVKKIDLAFVKEILSYCEGVRGFIADSSAKDAVDTALLFDLPELWEVLLIRDDVVDYIQNEMPMSVATKVLSTSSVMSIICTRKDLPLLDVIAYAKKTNFEEVWQFVVEKESDPKTLLSIIPILPKEYLKEEVVKKDSLVAYVKTLRYGAVVNTLDKTYDAILFRFVVTNTVARVSAVNILELAKKFNKNDKVWETVINVKGMGEYLNNQFKSGSGYFVHLARTYQSAVLWDYVMKVVNFDTATSVALELNTERVWAKLFQRPDFPKDDLALLLLIYTSTNNRIVWDLVLQFECMREYCNK